MWIPAACITAVYWSRLRIERQAPSVPSPGNAEPVAIRDVRDRAPLG
jgi:hypothetical protein